MSGAQDNGVCPHCGRADSVTERDAAELYNRAEFQRFICTACKAIWAGVRRAVTTTKEQRA